MVSKRFSLVVLSVVISYAGLGVADAKKGIGCGKDKIRICGAANVKSCDLSKHLDELSMGCAIKLNRKHAKAGRSGRK